MFFEYTAFLATDIYSKQYFVRYYPPHINDKNQIVSLYKLADNTPHNIYTPNTTHHHADLSPMFTVRTRHNYLWHNEHGPAFIEYENYSVVCVSHYVNNKLHNEHGPTTECFYPNGKLKSVLYYINNQLHHLRGPAVIYYQPTGEVIYKAHYKNDKLHNECGPAIIKYYPTGQITKIEYYINSKPHNEHGPAIVDYSLNGTIVYTEYRIHGRKVQGENLKTPR